MKKKILIFWLLLCICVTGFAEQESIIHTCGDYQYRVLKDGTAEIVRWFGMDTELTIAAELDGHKVSRIGDFAFSYCQQLKSVCIPYGVIEIGTSAFQMCSDLIEIKMPDSLKVIQSHAFTFCSLKSIEIPDSVTTIVKNPFYRCDVLERITVSKQHPVFVVEDGALIDRTEQRLICLPAGTGVKNFSIPYGIKTIGFGAFRECRLTNVTIPESVLVVEIDALSGNNFEFIEIPNSIQYIDGGPFSFCDKLSRIVVAANHPTLYTVDGVLFDKTKQELLFYPIGRRATQYTTPEGVTIINHSAFSGQLYLETIIISEGVTTIENGAFSNCSKLTSVTLPDTLKNIGQNPFFRSDSLKNIIISSDHPVLKVKDGALINWKKEILISYLEALSTKDYVIPYGIKEINASAFLMNERLQSVVIPDSVTRIETEAFNGCSNLEKVVVSNNVSFIGDRAFAACSSLTTLTVPTSVTSIGPYAFGGCPNLTLIVTADSVGETHAIGENIPFVYAN